MREADRFLTGKRRGDETGHQIPSGADFKTSKISTLSDPEFQQLVEKKRKARMAKIDAMPPEIRALVHEYGLNAITAIMSQGVTRPKAIRHIASTLMSEFSPVAQTYSCQGVSSHVR